ncbi:hypothetical protein [Brucella intermedia]|uniref:hypothetical protein n=1 Tax=Brucella intermedia TaxID=94625 RepID=UPI000EFA3FB7|nr:hypothetical protein [Brucella intermedia]
MSNSDEFNVLHKAIVKLQSESMVMQVMLTGMMEELKKVEGGEEILARVFDYTSEITTMYATQPNQPTNTYTLAVGMTDHWRKMLKV